MSRVVFNIPVQTLVQLHSLRPTVLDRLLRLCLISPFQSINIGYATCICNLVVQY